MIELSKEFVQHVDQFSWGAVTGQPGKPNNVSVQDAVGRKKEGGIGNYPFFKKGMAAFPIKSAYIVLHFLFIIS